MAKAAEKSGGEVIDLNKLKENEAPRVGALCS